MGRPNEVSPQPSMMTSCAPMALIPMCSPATTKGLRGPWASKASLGLGIVQIILGTLLIIAQSIVLAKHTVGGVSGMGFICGILFIVTGSFCIAAGKHKSKCLVVTVMVLSIISASFTTFMFVAGSVAVAIDNSEYRYRVDSWDYDYGGGCWSTCDYVDYGWEVPSPSPSPTPLLANATVTVSSTTPCPWICAEGLYDYYHNEGLVRFMLSLHGLMLCFTMIELILAVIVSALTCRAVRCCCDNNQAAQYSYVIPMAVNQPGTSQIPTCMLSSPAVFPMNYSGYAPAMPDVPQVHTQGEQQEAGAGTRPPSYSSLSPTETKKVDSTPVVDV